MNLRSTFAASIAGVLALTGASCLDSGSAHSDESDSTQMSAYDFQLPAPGDEMVRIDALGVALISTVLMNRDRTPSGGDNHNQYQIDTPDVQNNPQTLFSFIHFLRALHTYWRSSLSDLGFEPCSANILGIVSATPCTLQHLRFDEDPGQDGPRTIDVVLPDDITLDFDQPLRFPNGRTPWEPISDKIFALGFLKMGGKCPGIDWLPDVSDDTRAAVPRDADGDPICTLETFSDIPLQVPTNDRPFMDAFPYLAEPWFYPSPSTSPVYFWPTGTRMELPE